MSGPDDRDDKAPASRPADNARARTVGGSATVNRVLAGELCTGCGCASASGAMPWDPPCPATTLGADRPGLAAEERPNKPQPVPAPSSRPGPARQDSSTGIFTRRSATVRDPDPAGSASRDPPAGRSHVAISPGWPHRRPGGACDRQSGRSGRQHDRGVGDPGRGAGGRWGCCWLSASSPLAHIDRPAGRARGYFVFIGKPCDVSALRRLGAGRPEGRACVPLMLASSAPASRAC